MTILRLSIALGKQNPCDITAQQSPEKCTSMWTRGTTNGGAPIDTRPNIHQVLCAGAPVSSPLTSIPEETDVVDPVVPQAIETEPPTRSRQPESEPGSELGARNVRPRVGSELSEHRMNGDVEQPSTIIEVDTLQGAAGAATPLERRSSGGDPPDV